MELLGALIALGAALAFLLLAALVWWGVRRAVSGELATGFRSSPRAPLWQLLTLLAVVLPAAGAALLALLAAARILLVALGAG